MGDNKPPSNRTLRPNLVTIDDAEVARLEAIIESSNVSAVRAAARTCIQQLRLRTWLHLSLVRATQRAEEIEEAERCRAAGVRPPRARNAKAPIPEEP